MQQTCNFASAVLNWRNGAKVHFLKHARNRGPMRRFLCRSFKIHSNENNRRKGAETIEVYCPARP
jgi:hypothetical protein